MTHDEQQALIGAVGHFVVDEVARGLAPIRAELMRLTVELKQAETQAREMRYAGIWDSRSDYKRGNFVTHGGSVWHCNLPDVHTMPGSDPTAWTLACKRGDKGETGARA